MSDLWTPPPGFFPAAVTWFHPGNIERFQPVYRKDIDCNYIAVPSKITFFSPGCVPAAVGKPIHFWKGTPPTEQFWASVTGCDNGNYNLDGGPGYDISGGRATIGTGVLATIHDFAEAFDFVLGFSDPFAIRYGWLFSLDTIDWWRHGGMAIHWLGPPP